MHPLLRLIATQPELLATHAEAYADLVNDEIGRASVVWRRRLLLYAIVLCSLGVTGVLAGVALMLWAVIPASGIQQVWVLVVVPLLPAALATYCIAAAPSRKGSSAFDRLRGQLNADMSMLREASR